MAKTKVENIRRNFLNLATPIHPFLFAIYPILFLYSNNLEEVYLSQIFGPILISLLVTLLTLVFLIFLLKDPHKAALISSLALIIFFSYGHVFGAIENYKIAGMVIGRNKFLLPASLILFAVASLVGIRSKWDLPRLTKIVNFLVASLILFSLTSIGNYALEHGLKISKTKVQVLAGIPTKVTEDSEKLPDIYYIILDGYARASTLKTVHKFDNSEFLNKLKNRGFYVVDKSQSNYSITLDSVTSSLNMRYLDEIAELPDEVQKREKAIEMLRNNEVSKFLRGKGYTTLNIGTTWGTTRENPYADAVFASKLRSEFVSILYQTSALMVLDRLFNYEADSILYGFEKLKEIPDFSEPTFTFAHIVSPHPPYLFDREGNKRQENIKELGRATSWYRRDKYVDQLIFVNNKVEEAVEVILEKSKTKPIIIIQGDHGTGPVGVSTRNPKIEELNERMDNLSTYYLPKGGSKILYETITPVNSFRLIFNYYFGAKFEKLEDKSYFSSYDKYFLFKPVPPEPN